MPLPVAPPGHLRPLLAALADPTACTSLDESAWDGVIVLARNARLLGVLAHRLAAGIDVHALPARVRRHLQAGQFEARFRRQKVLHLLHGILPQLQQHPGPWVLLKGAAYIVQDLPWARGRLPADVDLMVPRRALDAIEQSLLQAGWEFEKNDPYDQHYYRAWSHELPSMRAAGQALELDLHHTILPPTGRIHPDTEALFADSVAIAGSPFRVLAPADQVLHAVVHLAQDSDFVGRVRDLLDIDALLRGLPLTDPVCAGELRVRAHRHGMARPLWIAASLCAGWFDTPGCSDFANALRRDKASLAASSWVIRSANCVLGPADPRTDRDLRARIAGTLLEVRSHWLRMPPWLLAYHTTAKASRALVSARAAKKPRGEPAG